VVDVVGEYSGSCGVVWICWWRIITGWTKISDHARFDA
jgi:hypothetical protein